MRQLMIVIVLGVVSTVEAQTFTHVPAYVAPQTAVRAHAAKPTKVDFALLAADAAVHSLDVYSTHQMLSRGDHELVLPDSISHHTAAMAAYSGAAVAADWLVTRQLQRHGHGKLARCFMLAMVAGDGYWAARNLTLPDVRRRK